MFLINFIDYVVRQVLRIFFILTSRPMGPAYNAEPLGKASFGLRFRYAVDTLTTSLPVQSDLYNRSPSSICFALFFIAKRWFIATYHLNMTIDPATAHRLQGRANTLIRIALSLVIVYAMVAYIYISCQVVPFAKILFAWLAVGAFLYLLISGFVYFTNKLSYSSNVDVIQRFWKRTFSLFWLIESGLFAFFVYMTLNASSEVWAGYDTPSLFKTQFFSLKMLFVRLCLLSTAILLTSVLVGIVSRQDSQGAGPLQVAITVLIVLSLWIESYQFYLFILCAPSYAWVFNSEVHEAVIEADMRRNRLLRNFVFVCALAKFWHFIFIAVNWFFYLNRQLENPEVRAGLLNSAIQNLLILYILNLIAMVPYIKHFIHRGLAKPYFWFLIDEGTAVLPQIGEFTLSFYANLIF